MSIINFMPSPFSGQMEIPDPFEKNVIMDLRFDNIQSPLVILDSSTMAHGINRYGDARQTAGQKKFGRSSCYFDGDWDYLNAPKHVAFNQAGDFTLEMWFRLDEVREVTLISHKSSAGSWPPLIWVGGNGSLIMHVVTNTTRIATPANAVKANQWHHLSYGRVGRVWNMYLDGVLCGTWHHNSSDQSWGDWIFQLAAQPYGAFSFVKGHIDHLRWWKGVAIRNGVNNFAPPTAPWKLIDRSSGSADYSEGTITFEMPKGFNTLTAELWGGGGDGSNGRSGKGGADGGQTAISALNLYANGGGGAGSFGGRGGTASGGDVNLTGANGGNGSGQQVRQDNTYSGSGGFGGNRDRVNDGTSGSTTSWRVGSDEYNYSGGGGGGGGGYTKKTFNAAQLSSYASLQINVGWRGRCRISWSK